MCPWTEYLPRTVNFCESRVCGLIAFPGETWSNLIYILVGLMVIWIAAKEKQLKYSTFGITAICVGVGSFLFHMTGTFWGEVLDVESMYLFSGLLITYTAGRLWGWGFWRQLLLYLAVTGGSLATLLTWHPIGVNLFVVHVLVFLALEGAIIYKLLQQSDGEVGDGMSLYMPLIWLGVFFFSAWGVWWLDILKVPFACNPDNHIFTGHSGWHFLNCWCFYFAYRFFVKAPKVLDEV